MEYVLLMWLGKYNKYSYCKTEYAISICKQNNLLMQDKDWKSCGVSENTCW